MKLDEIGFYTLKEERAKTSSITSPLYRCELILTDRCNLKCPYCRSLNKELRGDVDEWDAMATIAYWANEGLKNVRFSGGEPTLYPYLENLISCSKDCKIERVAVSTNGTASKATYDKLLLAGMDDVSISLDSGCCATGFKMTGCVKGAWEKASETIRYLSTKIYTTVGIVFTEENIEQAKETIEFVHSLGPSDIRVIPSAQFSKALKNLYELPDEILNKYPILKFRINNVKNGIPVRGFNKNSTTKCPLVLDDMAVAGNYHFPCIIYLREGGKPIGKVSENMRQERLDWYKFHNSHNDLICREQCLDVCKIFNGKREGYNK